MTDEQYMEQFMDNMRELVRIECEKQKSVDTFETTVVSISPLKIKVGKLTIDSDFIKVVNNVHLESGYKVLVIRSKDKQKYYIMGVIS